MKAFLHTSTLYKKIFIAFIVCFLFSITQSFSQAGTLDSSFGVNGKVTTFFNASSVVFPNATAIQQDGKILVAVSDGSSDLVLMRYQSNGQLDSSFGLDGEVKTYFSIGSPVYSSSLAIQPDGKIIEGGFYGYYFLLARFLSNGVLDSSFGNNGTLSTNPDNNQTELHAVALQGDGKILAGGIVGFGSCLIRYEPDGIVDSSFASNGMIRYSLGYKVNDLKIQNDGKIIVASEHWNEELLMDNFGIYRLLSNGFFDSTFGNNGQVFTDFSDDAQALSLAILKDNSIVACGFTGEETALAKYKNNGSVDSSFGINGTVTSSIGTGQNLLVQKDDKLIAGVWHSFNYNNDFVLTRFNVNGTADSTFGFNGIATADFGAQAFLYSGALQQDGKIIVTGFFGGSNSPNISLVRFKGDPVSVSIQKNLTTLEGNSGTKLVTFKILLNETSSKRVTVGYTTVDGTAKAGQDYVAASGTITFRPGETSKRVTVNVVGDNVVEKTEKFSLQLSNPKNAILGTLSTATCAIKNDDPSFAIASSNEGAATTNSIKLYPNPAKDVLQIEGLSKNANPIISVIDMQGKVVMKNTTSNTTSLNIKSLLPGTYFLRIENEDKSTTLKFVKE